MARWWNRSLLPVILAFFFAAPAMAASGVFPGSVSQNGHRVRFPGLKAANLSNDRVAVAEFTFRGDRKFDVRAFRLALNGAVARLLPAHWQRYSRWENRQGKWVLVVNLGTMPFENGFVARALATLKCGRELRVWITAPYAVQAAQIVFLPPSQVVNSIPAARKPRPWMLAEITKATPAEAVTASHDMQLEFVHRPGGVRRFYTECRLDGGAYKKCASPVIYRGLAAGSHRVDVRLVWGFWFWWSASQADSYEWTIRDEQNPVVQWVSTPALLTREVSASFEFQGTDASSFECSLDGSFESCTSPWAVSGLSEGVHSVQVVGRSASGAASAAISYQWQIDATAPSVAFSSLMPQQSPTSLARMVASFSSSETGTLSCSLDGESLGECVSPLALDGLAEGAHQLEVWATDAAGNTGAAAVYGWVVDLTHPSVSIELVAPTQLPTNQTSATFHLVPSETATFLCSLDGGEEASCASNLQLDNLADGAHRLVVTPSDVAGNAGESASFDWVVDLVAPVVSLVSADPGDALTAVTSMRLDFAVSEAASVSCELDAAGAAPCSSPLLANGLADGVHALVVRATDHAGNTGTPWVYEWRVATPALVSLVSISPEAALSNQTSAAFSFVSAQSTRFECAMDSASFGTCMSPATFASLSDGMHTFQVRALNGADQAGPAAVYSWTVDATAPVVQMVAANPSAAVTASASMELSFNVSESATAYCRLDSGVEQVCQSPATWSELSDGSHQVSIAAVDSVGNRGPAVTYSWTVQILPVVLQSFTAQQITRTSALMQWTTSIPAHGRVEYGLGSAFNLSTPDVLPDAASQSVTLTGLTANAVYQARVRVTDPAGHTILSAPISFRTLR